MSDFSKYKYRAFLSYSHNDRKWAEWLHQRLERYHVDESLVGQQTLYGRVPNRLRPVFRDREGLSAGSSINSQIDEALSASSALIVICSPSAVRSQHVQQEIRTFKKRGSNDRVFCFIVDGVPHDPHRNCIPAPLLIQLRPSGELAGEDTEPLAADARPTGDGRELALSKIISGLLGVPLTAIWRRERERQRRRYVVMTSICAAMLLLAAGAATFATIALRSQARSERLILNTLDRAAALVATTTKITREYGVATDVTIGFLQETEETLAKVKEIGGDRPELLFRQAQLNLRFSETYATLGRTAEQFGKADEALTILLHLTQHPRTLRERALDATIDSWRSLNKMHHQETDRVIAFLQRWLRVHSAIDTQLPVLLKRAYRTVASACLAQGNYTDALIHFEKGLAIDQYAGERSALIADDHIIDAQSLLGIANLHHRQREYVQALEKTTQAIERLQRLKPEIRTAIGYQALTEAYINAADLHRTIADRLHGRSARPENYAEAVAHIDEALQLAARLLGDQPKNALRAQLLAQANMVMGDIRKRQKYYGPALAAYERSKEIRQTLLDGDTNNASVKNELAYSFMKIGEAKRDWPDHNDKKRKLHESIQAYERAIELFEQLRRLPRYLPARRNTWLALWGMEDPLEKLGQSERLLTTRKHKLEIAQEGYRHGIGSPQSLRDLVQSHKDVAELLLRHAKPDEAGRHFEAVLALTKEAPDTNPNFISLQRYRSESYLGLGQMRLKVNEPGPATEVLGTAWQLADSLHRKSPRDTTVLRLLSDIAWYTSDAQMRIGRHRDALRTCRDSTLHLQSIGERHSLPAEISEQLHARSAECDAREKAHAF